MRVSGQKRPFVFFNLGKVLKKIITQTIKSHQGFLSAVQCHNMFSKCFQRLLLVMMKLTSLFSSFSLCNSNGIILGNPMSECKLTITYFLIIKSSKQLNEVGLSKFHLWTRNHRALGKLANIPRPKQMVGSTLEFKFMFF